MFELITVCTGNICRSPLAEVLFRTRLSSLPVRVRSAGTRGLTGHEMTPEAQRLATDLGAPAEEASEHRARFLTEGDLLSPDLILGMSREHRRAIAELAPSRMRSVFTLRELARLIEAIDIREVLAAADSAGGDPSSRVRAATATVAAQRGVVALPADPLDDDVIDPYRQSWETYELSAAQIAPSVDIVARFLRQVATAPTG